MMNAEQAKDIILLATHNQGKVAEMHSALKGYQVESLDYLPDKIEDVEENGLSFEENALLKARFVAKKTGFIALADDSGLEIQALDSAPGIYSARYAQRRNDSEILSLNSPKDLKNILQVLKDMKGIENRKARFCCCLALVFPKTGQEIVVHGYWEGEITKEIIGENGFGYDPIFLDKSLGKTSAELTKAEKMQISHRARAIVALQHELNILS